MSSDRGSSIELRGQSNDIPAEKMVKAKQPPLDDSEQSGVPQTPFVQPDPTRPSPGGLPPRSKDNHGLPFKLKGKTSSA
jgi:hypothetical protein